MQNITTRMLGLLAICLSQMSLAEPVSQRVAPIKLHSFESFTVVDEQWHPADPKNSYIVVEANLTFKTRMTSPLNFAANYQVVKGSRPNDKETKLKSRPHLVLPVEEIAVPVFGFVNPIGSGTEKIHKFSERYRISGADTKQAWQVVYDLNEVEKGFKVTRNEQGWRVERVGPGPRPGESERFGRQRVFDYTDMFNITPEDGNTLKIAGQGGCHVKISQSGFDLEFTITLASGDERSFKFDPERHKTNPSGRLSLDLRFHDIDPEAGVIHDRNKDLFRIGGDIDDGTKWVEFFITEFGSCRISRPE